MIMYQIDYEGYTILLGEETGKWVCFESTTETEGFSKIMDVAKHVNHYPEIIRSVLSDKLSKIDRIEIFEKKFSLLIIVTSNTCNMECKYCYMSSSKPNSDSHQMISSKKMIEIIDAFSKEYSDDSFEILFQGGEPMLSFNEIKTTIEYYRKIGKKYTFCIQSNGTLFNEENLRFLKKYGVRIGISRDSNSDGDGELREIASHNINTILDAKEKMMRTSAMKYGVISVVSSNNVENICEYAVDLLEKGVNRFSFNPFYPIGRGTNLKCSFPPIDKYTEEMKRLFDFLYKKNLEKGYRELDLYAENNLFILWERIFKRKYEMSCCNKAPCGAGDTTLTVDWNGDIYPCTYFLPNIEQGHILGNIDNIRAALTSVKSSVVQKRDVHSIPKCSICPYKRICGGGGCTGSIYYAMGINRESYYCEFYREIIPYIITSTMRYQNKKVLSNY